MRVNTYNKNSNGKISCKTKFNIFMSLMKTDFQLLFTHIKSKLLDAIIWGGFSLSVATFIYPMMGMKNFGLFQAPSIFIGVVGFEMYSQLFLTTMNIEQKGHWFYLFTLPISSSIVFAQKILFYTLNGLILGLTMIPLSKIILFNQLNLASIAWAKLLIALVSSCFFFACFLLIIVSITKSTKHVEHLFMRVMFPLWFIGGFQFSWFMLLKLNKIIAYIALISPYTYAHEAARAAVLGQEGYIAFHICIAILLVGGLIFAYIGYKRLKKQLDLA